MAESTIAVCKTCGMPVRVIFDDEGEVERVLAVCGHPPAKQEQGGERKYGGQGSGTKTTFGGGDAYDG